MLHYIKTLQILTNSCREWERLFFIEPHTRTQFVMISWRNLLRVKRVNWAGIKRIIFVSPWTMYTSARVLLDCCRWTNPRKCLWNINSASSSRCRSCSINRGFNLHLMRKRIGTNWTSLNNWAKWWGKTHTWSDIQMTQGCASNRQILRVLQVETTGTWGMFWVTALIASNV